MNTTIKFCIFELAKVPNFSLNWQFWICSPNLPKRVFPFEIGKSMHHHWILFSLGIKFALKEHSRSKTEKVNTTTELHKFGEFWYQISAETDNFDFLDQIYLMVFTVENRKSKHHHCILHIRISRGTKFQLKLSKFVQFSGGVHFFCFRPGMPFRANFIPRLNWIFRFQWWCTLFLISNGNTLLGEFGQKIQNCQFKLKFGTLANLNM